MRCVECGARVDSVYRSFGAGNIRMTTCESCGRFADKYVEYELLLVCMDLLLMRVEAFRHCIFNVARKGMRVSHRCEESDKQALR